MNTPIIDFHTHPYLTADEFYCFYPEGFVPSPAQMKEDLSKAGISHICGSVLLKEKYDEGRGFGYLKECNLKALLLKEALGNFYTPGFHVHPDYVKESCEEIEKMNSREIRLIGELVPYMHGWNDYSNKGLQDILDVAESFHMAVSYHTMPEEQEEMEKMVAAHPGITFIAAHPGEREDYQKHLERMKKYDNLYLDISGTGLFRYGMLAYGVNEVGSDRFLFGTDYPICNPKMYAQAILQEPITESARENIFYYNSRRLLETLGML